MAVNFCNLELPMVVQAWDVHDVQQFNASLESCGVKTDVWLVCTEGNDAYAFTHPSKKPPSHAAVANAFHRLLTLEDNTPGPSVKDTRNLLLRKFKRLKM